MKTEKTEILPVEYRNNSTEVARFANAFVESVHKLDLAEKKLLAFITHKMQKKGQKEISITSKEMLDWSGLGLNNYSSAKEKLDGLMRKGSIEYENMVPDNKGNMKREWVKIQFLQDIKYREHEGAVLTLSDKMANFIFDVNERYTEVFLVCICNFSSKYSLRLYELCKQYLKAQNRVFAVNDLALLLNTPDTYKRPALMMERAINPSVKDINSYSDILVEVKKSSSSTPGKSFVRMKIKENPNFNPKIRTDDTPKLPGIDTHEKEKNDFEITLRKAGMKGPIGDVIKNAGGLDAAEWYWKNILSKDIERQKPKFPNGYIRKQYKDESRRAYELHIDQKKRNFQSGPTIDVTPISIKAENHDAWKIFKSLTAEEKIKAIKDNLHKASNDFVRDYVTENYLDKKTIESIKEENYKTWIEQLLS